jgi:hypothetical protein
MRLFLGGQGYPEGVWVVPSYINNTLHYESMTGSLFP